MRKGLFVGTFDPFTIGHDAIVRRALRLFDELVIGVGVNEAKHPESSAEERVAAIRKLYVEEPKVSVVAYEGLTVDLARECGAEFIVKGVRSIRDFDYEREQAELNRKLSGIETILLVSDPELANVSSTFVRTLRKFGRDVSEFLPKVPKASE
ncbi:MAG: pantetheine-phosphate adenylyltransferase [Prevotella sp.]|nr:pantetheine-phosphate adenylyltransferase [Prevotella sp.]